MRAAALGLQCLRSCRVAERLGANDLLYSAHLAPLEGFELAHLLNRVVQIHPGGGFVEDGRVQGIIAVSRAIGDWEYKNPGLLQQLHKKHGMKKKKSTTAKAEEEKKTVKTGPYRNIEEAKKHQVSSFPDIKKVPLKPEHDFIIVACDGIWDCYTNE